MNFQASANSATLTAILWAKSDPAGGDGWMPLRQHMADSAAVANLLWREWLAESVRQQIIEHCGSEMSAQALVVWLASAHDLGKGSPAFQFKVPALADRVRRLGLPIPDKIAHPLPHSLLSHGILQRWLVERSWNSTIVETYAIIPGGHHGMPPNSQQMRFMNYPSIPSEVLGEGLWPSVQTTLADYAAELGQVEPFLERWSAEPLSPQMQVLLTGIIIMADWLASNIELFPLQDNQGSPARAALAWQELALPGAWQPMPTTNDNLTLFHNRFNTLPAGAALRPAQVVALDAARNMQTPGLMIVEAPMGMGKTEIGLLAAEIWASTFGEGGVSFLLPTMATSDAMFGRVKQWLEHLPDQRGSSQEQTIKLAHGKAALNSTYRDLPRWGHSSMGDDEPHHGPASDNVIAHQWLSGRKRSLLSSFVVGTVDQLLMGALKAKHVVLRHLGLAGKVVIVDEVHAYDSYMSTYLERILEWLGAYHVPVILLSATLPPDRRVALIQAYRKTFVQSSENHVESFPASPRQIDGNPAYPLITVCEPQSRQTGADDIRCYPCEADTRRTTILVDRIPDDDASLIELLETSLSEGGCIGIIRDTVGRAQHTFDVVSQAFDIDVRLTHSRFIAVDRSQNDRNLVDLLGPESKERPRALVVVGTQVLEQSLDIDFDLLITDVAPVDLLLQRMGRLHRHQRGEKQSERPERLRQARCVLTGVTDWEVSPPAISRDIRRVYSPSLLLRTLCELDRRNSVDSLSITLPDDIAPLVEAVYAKKYESPDEWAAPITQADEKADQERKEKKSKAQAYLLGSVPRPGKNLMGWIDVEVKNADDNVRGQAAVRDTEESIEVIVVQKTDGQVRLLPWVEKMSEVSARVISMEDSTAFSGPDGRLGRVIETSVAPPDNETARLAASCTVRLPPAMSQWRTIESVLGALERVGSFESWQQSGWLKGQLPLVLDADFNAYVAGFSLHYDRHTGLQLVTKEDTK